MKTNYYRCILVSCMLCIAIASCKEDEEVLTPQAASLTVDKNSGIKDVTEFTFTIGQVSCDAISFFPYGVEDPSLRGNLIDEQAFVEGKAIIKIKYTKIGSYNAVIVTNNHSKDGKSVMNVSSSPQTITITE